MSGADTDRPLACDVRRIEWVRYDCGELPEVERSRLEGHLQGCAHCQGVRAGQLSARAELDPAQVAAASVAILERLERPAPRRLAWLRPQLWAGVVAAAIALVVVLPQAKELLFGEGPRIRTKGAQGPSLEMWVNTPEGAQPGVDGMHLGEGDQIQFRYRASGRQYVLVVSVDSRGVTSPLYPEAPGQSLKISPEGEHVLDGSVILDDAKGPERIFAFFSDSPLSYEEVVTRLRQAVPPGTDLSKVEQVELTGADLESVLIIKE